MKEEALPYKQMIFVCTNARAKGERISCAGEGRCGQDLLDKLKGAVKKNRLEGIVRVAKSGCQEKCEVGPNVMVMPQNLFLSGVTMNDADGIISRFLAPHSRAGV
jgi:(2Fe-2S) ferredoxin